MIRSLSPSQTGYNECGTLAPSSQDIATGEKESSDGFASSGRKQMGI